MNGKTLNNIFDVMRRNRKKSKIWCRCFNYFYLFIFILFFCSLYHG